MCASIWVTTLWVMSFLFVCACYAKNTMCEIPRSILIIFGFAVTEVIGYGKVSEIIVSLTNNNRFQNSDEEETKHCPTQTQTQSACAIKAINSATTKRSR